MLRKMYRSFIILIIVSLLLAIFAFSWNEAYAASGSTKYIAHRGWSSRAPENTLAAFKLAAKNSKFYGVEFDVWEAAYTFRQDPLLLVMHDDNIQRMCGVNKDIRKIGRKTLGRYTIKSGNNISKYKGQKIPTVEQALDTICKYSKGAIPVIELKHRLSRRALKYLLEYLGGREAVIISFDFSAVSDAAKMARRMGIDDSIQTMYLLKSLSSKRCMAVIRRMKSAGIDCISLRYTAVSKTTVRRFHKSSLKVCTWTLPDKSTARKYARMGVDYITANGAVY